jgi:hypothetical protein
MIAFALSIGLFFFAYAILKIQCIPHAGCNLADCSNTITYGIDTYTSGHSISGIYFIIFSFTALLKSYPSK